MNQKKDNEISPKELAMGAIFSKRLTDVHAHNLKMYPYICFDGVQEVEIDYDLKFDRSPTDEAPPYIKYNIHFKEGAKTLDQEEVKKRVKYLQDAVAVLLWKEIEVSVYNKTTGRRLVENV